MNTKIIKELDKNPSYLKAVYNISKACEETLAHDIRVELSLNEVTPVDILETLIKDDDVQIRLNVIKLKSTSPKIVACAVRDLDDNVRLQALKCQYVVEDDLIMLFQDKNAEVVALARKTLKSRL